MLITEPSHLGDRVLSKEEALLKSFQETDRALQRFRLDDHEHLKDVEARMGKPMLHTDLIRRVLKLNSAIWTEDSNNDSSVVGFYTRDQEGNKVYLVAFEKGILPEFSFILTDAADLPVKEKRGWRTVLLRLLKQNALSWPQIVAIFGDAHGFASDRWRAETQRYRQ